MSYSNISNGFSFIPENFGVYIFCAYGTNMTKLRHIEHLKIKKLLDNMISKSISFAHLSLLFLNKCGKVA